MPINDVAILLPSWDGFSDIWDIYFRQLDTHWPDCPFPFYLGTTHIEYTNPKVTSIPIKSDIDFSSNLQLMLDEIPYKWVIIWIEDFVIDTDVDSLGLIKLINYVKSTSAAYARLSIDLKSVVNWFVKPSADCPELGELLPNSPYRAGLTISMWDKEILQGLLRSGENAWQFEYDGSTRSQSLSKSFLAITRGHNYKPYLSTTNLIRKGRWTYEAQRFFKKNNYKFGDFKPRKSESWFDHFKINFRFYPRLAMHFWKLTQSPK